MLHFLFLFLFLHKSKSLIFLRSANQQDLAFARATKICKCFLYNYNQEHSTPTCEMGQIWVTGNLPILP